MAAIESLTAEAIIAMVNQGTWPPQFDISTSDLSALNSAMAVDVSKASTVFLHVKNSGTVTMAAGQFIFEASVDSTTGIDGTWFPVQAARTSANLAESVTGTLGLAAAAGMAYAWKMSVAGLKWIRVRTSTAVTASALATWTAIRSAEATEPVPAIATHAVTGSGTFLVSPSTSTGYALVTTASTNGALIITGSKVVGEITVFNPTAAVIYVKLYNKATAPTVGTDVPLVTIPVPINGLASLDMGQLGKRFTLGLGIAVTAGPLATDAVVVAAGAQVSLTYV